MDRDDVVRPLPRRPQRPPASTGWRKWRGRLLVIVLPLVLIIGSLLRFWVDLLWFGELEQRAVLVTRLQWSTAMGVAFGLLTFAVLYGNFVVARRVAREDLYVPFLAVGADPEAPEQPVVPHFVLRPVLLGVAAVAAVLSGLIMSSRWEVILRFVGRTDFGVTDPHFGKDASFYVFTMPLLELIARSLQALLVITAIGVGLAYVATGVVRYTPVPRIARAATVHLSWLAAAFLLVSAFQYRLSIWDLATSTRGVVAGAGWTDTHARIPGYWLMLVASIVLAIVIVLYARRERWRIVGGAIVGWFAASVLVTGVVPSLVQNVLVEPNELERETALLEGNIANTRAAFGLGAIRTSQFRDEATLDEQELLRDNEATTENLRLWSPPQLEKVVKQEQALRRYYTFNTPDVDRYTIGDNYRQVMVSVRELDPSASTVASGWTNERLAFTHGFGAVATLPNEVTSQGRPRYLVQDLPPRTTGKADSLELTRPEIYYGEAANDFVIAGSRQPEVSGARGDAGDEAAGDDDSSSYEGEGGVPISGAARRVAFAATFRDPRILFSGQFTEKSRLMFRRTIRERVETLAPFLELDGDPYAVIIDGRIKWIADAYTTSERFPYSTSVEVGEVSALGRRQAINYMRNSVKAVIDAYDGDVTLYAMEVEDPILDAWRSIFPTLFTNVDEMPEELRDHVRFPQDLFEVQTGLWMRYHMTDVADFFRREDQWAAPTIDDQAMEAFYVLAKLPGETSEELLLIRPLTPLNRKNMVAYMVARSDGENYGRVESLELSSRELTQGPSQVQALIKQDTEVARQVREWTTDNTVIFGDLLVLPVEKSLLYAQPVYLQNQEAEIPEFQRIVLVLGDTIAWGEDFAEAARTLLQERASDIRENASDDSQANQGRDEDAGGDGDEQDPAPDVPEPSGGEFEGMSQADLARSLAEIDAAYARAQACQRRDDLVCFAREVERIEQLLAAAREGSRS